jgi:hypothetical protein
MQDEKMAWRVTCIFSEITKDFLRIHSGVFQILTYIKVTQGISLKLPSSVPQSYEFDSL